MEKFKKPRLLTPRGQSHKKFWQAVGLCALTAAIFFLPFYILDGGFFHYAGDFNSQQITFYRYMNGFVKGAGYPDSAFAGAPRNTFSWATDLGSGVMNAYSFYLYGSPFFWLSVLLPQSWLPYMMVPLLVLKFGVAGGGAFLYLRRYVKNENYAVLGACLYALSGFAVYNVFFNHFVDVVALFPYLLWALDEAIYENRHGLFAFWVAVNLLNNYFFFVGQVIFLCIYFVCKLTAKDFRLTGRKFGHLCGRACWALPWVVCCCSRQCSVCCRTRAPLTFPPAGAFWPTPRCNSIWLSCSAGSCRRTPLTSPRCGRRA